MTVADSLLSWYDRSARDLPWRRTRDPYAVLVSEVMLQQTQVSRVIERYERWLEVWPDEHALSAASPGDVVRAWVGLGYNRRALALHRCAQQVAAHGWPTDAVGLRALPGVGPYTAAAVATFAFRERVAAVDVNHARVIARVYGLTDATPRALAARADAEVPVDRPDAYNQALMDLGATVCQARRTDCPRCPLEGMCASVGDSAVVAPSPRRSGAPRQRFEDSDRFVRGRVVAALAVGDGLPGGFDPPRLLRALDGLLNDGLIVRTVDGFALP